jgi:hypothetical protein
MEAKQLRIGNLVTDEFYESFNTIIEVESINEKGINVSIEDDGNYPECAQRWIEAEYKYEVLKPIPLREDWLLKLGFKKVIYKTVYPDCFDEICYELEHKEFFISYLDDFSMGLYVQKTTHQNDLSIVPSLENMKYVHQLQNLYFALTGEELKLIEKI